MEHYVTDWTVLMFLQCGNYNLETSAWLTFDTEHKKKNENSYMYIWYTFKKSGFLTNKVPD